MTRSALIVLGFGLHFGAAVMVASASGCHVAGCAEGDLECAQQTSEPATGTTTQDPSTTEGSPTTQGTSDTSDTGEPDTEDPGTTIGPPPNCGDGDLDVGEVCDDGNKDNTDACVGGCVPAACGDGFVQFGAEACDDGNSVDGDDCTNACSLARCGDGVLREPFEQCDNGGANNDVLYGGCTKGCQLGARCGDGKVNGPETCDDKNEDQADGCLTGCVEAISCLQIHEVAADAPTGTYRIWPTALGGNINVQVWCDMNADGGGYTYLKIDTQVMGESDKGAVAAEALCHAFGMHLLAPRTPAHVQASYAVATTSNLPPIGGGNKGAGVEYMSILGIYPASVGATCDGKGLNSVDCPGWRATDDAPFWVTDVANADEPSDEHCDGCSMLYKWNMDGTLKSYTTFPSGEGAGSFRFLCDIGDKRP